MSAGNGQSVCVSGNSGWRLHEPVSLPFAVGLLILGIMLAGFPGGRMVTEAKETGTAVTAKKKDAAAAEEQEVIAFVTAYREALSPEGIDTLADYVDNPDDVDFQRDLLRNQAMFKLGVTGWENIRVIAKPMSDGKHWVASVSSDLRMDDFDYGVPGLNVVLVKRNEKGELKIMLDDGSEFSDTSFINEVREISLSDEIMDHSNGIAVAYNALLAEHPELVELLESMNMKVEEELGEMLKEQLPVKVETDSEQQKPDAGKGSYTVKKGDCLWHIAEDQLGDGMLWNGLYETNKEVIGEDPDLLYVGITLQL